MTTLDIKLRPKGRAVRLSGAAVPARIPPDKSYRGRVSRVWIDLRNGREVEKIVAAIKRAGYERVSIGTYYNWESGKTDPPICALPAIAKALGVKVSDLLLDR